jgi:uncharacterized membrane protein YqaE (UPF0057 family)
MQQRQNMPRSVKKKSLVSRLFHKLKEESAEISQGLYIVLGWLAIGINDDFTSAHWLIALLLTILGWLPGVVYSLIVMGDYY